MEERFAPIVVAINLRQERVLDDLYPIIMEIF